MTIACVRSVRLGEVLIPSNRAVPSSLLAEVNLAGVYSFGRGLFKRGPMKPAETSYKTYNRLVADDFVISQPKAWEGALARVTSDFDGWYLSPVFPTFTANSDRLLPAYLEWFCKRRAVWRDLQILSKGMGARRETVSSEQFLSLQIPLPPLDEQRRIVSRIEQLTAKVNEARGLRSLASTELTSTLAASRRAFFGEAPAVNWIALGAHVAEIENGRSPATEGRVAELHEWAVLKVGAVSFGSFDDRENKALPPSFKPLERYEVKAGDFLMSRANTTDLVGACAIVRSTRPRLMLSDKIFRFKFRTDSSLSVEYLDHVLKSPALRKQIVSGATGTSPTMKNISKEKVLALLIPDTLPSDQGRIVAELDALQTKVEAAKLLQSETAAELSAMLPAILDTAFKGEL
jgi:type I restriction enzyme, S subunit